MARLRPDVVELAPRRRGAVVMRTCLGVVLLAAAAAFIAAAVLIRELGAILGGVGWGGVTGAFGIRFVRPPAAPCIEVEENAFIVRSPGEFWRPWRVARSEIAAVVIDERAATDARLEVAGEPLWRGACRHGFPIIGDPGQPPNVALVLRAPRQGPGRIPMRRSSVTAALCGVEGAIGGALVAVQSTAELRTALARWNPTPTDALDELPAFRRGPRFRSVEPLEIDGPLRLVNAGR